MKFPSLQQQENDIMNRFNFERVLVTMHALNWTWFDGGPVTVDDLKNTALTLLGMVQNEHERSTGWKAASTGGFEARIDEQGGYARMSLAFRVDWVDAAPVY
jgi:hypothetical protein